jgi:hypothetical protein
MVFSLRRWVELSKILILFVLLSFIFYQLITILVVWIEPVDPYKEPMGRAIKVFHYEESVTTEEGWTWMDRLKFFYWFGE